MVIRRVSCFLLSVVLLLPSAASADLIELYGDERVGGSAGQFLRIPVGARAVGLGNASAALARGATAIFSNPGAMSTVRFEHSLFASHFAYAAGIDVHHLGYVRRSGSWQYGVGLGVLDSGEIERTTERQPEGTGQTFEADQFVATLSAARLLTDRITLGASVKLLQESLDDFESRGILLDLGALYYIGYRTARIGFAVNNFGPDLRLNGEPPADAGFSGEWQSFPAPTMASFGFAYDTPTIGSENILTVGLDFLHPTDEAESIVLASELSLRGTLALRAAYRQSDEIEVFSGGLGLEWPIAERPVHLDYGFVDRGSFGLLHTITLEIER
ncbi:MAG TPA: PorV/PorQ family protein [Candidatus Krumholzibacteria bacterium]|nr:PorV/PorQ family protein [Candidatus Krumholzibacteria bacterium]